MKTIENAIILEDEEIVILLKNFIKNSEADAIAEIFSSVYEGTYIVTPEDEGDFGSDITYKFIPNSDFTLVEMEQCFKNLLNP
jgi:hypothetical protein